MSTDKVVVLFSLKIVYVKNRSAFKTVFIQGRPLATLFGGGGGGGGGGLAKYRKTLIKMHGNSQNKIGIDNIA